MHVKLPAVTALLLLPLLASGCSNGASADNAPSATPTSAAPVPSPTPSPTPTGDPLTGLAPVGGSVIAVKVDNADLARPYHRGLRQAAIVYQELVEGGATRFMAVYQSASAKREVGPIRSARESDIDILRGFGKPAIAFSGANNGVLAIFRSAARKGYLVDASYDVIPGAYRLGERRRDARNFFAVPAVLAAKRTGSSPRDIGWRFGPSPAGVPDTSATASFSPRSHVAFRYDAKAGTYVVSQKGRVVPVAPANVIVQFVKTKPSRFYDVSGHNTPYTISTGSGRVVVFRDGVRVKGTWKRKGFGPTRLVDATGADILLKPGATWLMLVPNRGSLTAP